MKFDFKGYFLPTPRRMKQLGIAFKAIAALSVPTAFAVHKWIGLGMFVLSILGEFLTNFFVTDDDKTQDK